MHPRASFILCAALLALFAILSYSAALTKSPTSDEPLHALGGYLHRTAHDFRINPEDPPLFGYWASLPHRAGTLRVDFDSPQWRDMLKNFGTNQWPFVAKTLFDTAGNDGDRFIQRSRLMFVPVGVMLGALIAWWAWRLSGATAALIATTLFALDPTFLGHASLVKNDVMASLTTLALAISLWQFGVRGSWLGLIAIAGTCAVAVNAKFSGVLCGPILLAALLARAIVPRPWNVLGKNLTSRVQRLVAVPLVCLLVAALTYASIWACYGFRYAPTNDPTSRLDLNAMVDFVKKSRTAAQFDRVYDIPPQAEQQQKAGIIPAAVVWADSHRLLPNAWLDGFLYTYATTLSKPTFLLGHVGVRGVWYYFPLAMLFKTPTATLAAMLLALLALRRRRVAREEHHLSLVPFDLWTILCFVVPMGIYLQSALTSGINIGVRHVLPLYPFIFVLVGIALATLIDRWGRRGTILVSLLLLSLAVESLAAYPDYIAFFNAPSGGSRRGIRLLGDSNLDWGQDLKLLAKWQQSHRDKKLYFAYFGTVFPAFYGIDATMMPGGVPGGFDVKPSLPGADEDCYIAISATILQGVYLPKEFENLYRSFQQREPIAVVGETIYVYASSPAGRK